jgi:hypothetical protein
MHTVYYSGGERAERGVAIVVHKLILISAVKKTVFNDRIIALKLKTETVTEGKIEGRIRKDGKTRKKT